MSKKHKQSKKTAKNLKRTEVATKPEDEIDTESVSTIAEARQTEPSIPEAEVPVESKRPLTSVSATPAIPQPNVPEVRVDIQQADSAITEAARSETAPKTTRSDAAKANIKQGLAAHKAAGRPSRESLILIFGKAGYLMTWPQRIAKFGITPETFPAVLATGIPAVPLTPVAKPTVENTNEST